MLRISIDCDLVLDTCKTLLRVHIDTIRVSHHSLHHRKSAVYFALMFEPFLDQTLLSCLASVFETHSSTIHVKAESFVPTPLCYDTTTIPISIISSWMTQARTESLTMFCEHLPPEMFLHKERSHFDALDFTAP